MNREAAMGTIRERPNTLDADELRVRFAGNAADKARLELDAIADELGVDPRQVTVDPDYANLCAMIYADADGDAALVAYVTDEHADARLVVADPDDIDLV